MLLDTAKNRKYVFTLTFLLVLLTLSSKMVSASSIEDWTALPSVINSGTTFGGAGITYSVAYGGGKFVAVGSEGRAAYSTNGITWTMLPAGDSTGVKFGATNAKSVTYGGDKFVVVGESGKASYSADGVTWTALAPGTDTGIKFGSSNANSVAYGGGKFVVVGESGKASYSADGVTWTALAPGTDTGIRFTTTTANTVAYGTDKFVVAGELGKASYSADGVTWTVLTAGVGSGIKLGLSTAYSVSYGSDKFVVVGTSGKASYSADGITWTVLTAGDSTGIKFGTDVYATSVVYGSDKFVVVGGSGYASYSLDGVTWNVLTPGAEDGIKFNWNDASSVTYGSDKFVVVGNSGYGSYSSDGVTWTTLDNSGAGIGIKVGYGYSARSVAYGGDKYVMVGSSGKASYSADGVSWTELAPGADSGIKFDSDSARAVAYGGNKFVTVGESGKASYSADGVTWTALTPGADSGIIFESTTATSVAYGGNKFVTVGESGKASYSADGVTWTALTPGADSGIKFNSSTAISVTYGSNKFVVVGNSGKASYSTDGVSWTALTPGAESGIKFDSDSARAVTYGNGKYVVVGDSGKASYSTDGVSWTALTPGAESGIKFDSSTAYAITYSADMFIVVGESGKASYSSDGVTWTALTPGYDTGIRCMKENKIYSVVYGSDKFLVVGENGVASYNSYTTPDTDAPVISVTPLSPDPNSDSTPIIAGTATDAVGTISNVQYQMDGTAGSWTACTANTAPFDTASEAFTCTVSSALLDGSHTIYIRATDSNTNTTAGGSESTDAFTIDTIAPTGGSISINEVASYTTTTAVTLTLSATGATQMIISEDSGFSGATWETYDTSKATILTASNGTKTIYAKFRDAAENNSETVSDTIILDTLSPGAPGSPATTSPTTSTTQTWTWTAATEATSGVASYAWRVITTLGDAVTNGTTNLTSVITNLTAGSYNFLVRAIDGATNQGDEASGALTVVRTSAETEGEAKINFGQSENSNTNNSTSNEEETAKLGKNTVTNSDRTEVRWERPSDTSIIERYVVHYREKGSGKWKTETARATADSVNFDPGEGSYEWFLEVVYNDGSTAETTTYKFEVDETAPELGTIKLIDEDEVITGRKSLLLLPFNSNLRFNTGNFDGEVIIEIWNSDQSTHYDTMVCGPGICDKGHKITGPLTLVVFIQDKTGNVSDKEIIQLSTIGNLTTVSLPVESTLESKQEIKESLIEEQKTGQKTEVTRVIEPETKRQSEAEGLKTSSTRPTNILIRILNRLFH